MSSSIEAGNTLDEKDAYRILGNLVDCFFFQDYDIWGETPDEIVEVYKYIHPPARRPELVADIQRFLTQYGGSEAELEEAFRRIFHPEMAIYGWNGRTLWEALEKIVEILQDDANPGRPVP